MPKPASPSGSSQPDHTNAPEVQDGHHGGSQTDRLVALGLDEGQLFHDKEGTAFAKVSDGDTTEIRRIDSKAYRLWLQRRFRHQEGRTANQNAVQAAVSELAGEALFSGPETATFLRVGAPDGAIELDLGVRSGEVVRISSEGWRVGEPTAAFPRRRNARGIPRPVAADGGVEELRSLVNLGDEQDFRLIVGWLLMTLNPNGPFPVLVLEGEQGSAKSTTARALKQLIDPVTPLLRSLPRSERDLAIAANANWVLAFDNVSFIQDWMSDALCRLSTGGGFGTRTLYEGEEETVFEQTRPLILNGLESVARRQDLLDRSIVVSLPGISPEKRMPEEEFWVRFRELQPRIMGSLLDAAVAAQANLPDTHPPELPRLADFARWVAAGETALGWETGAFVDLFRTAQADALRASLEGSVVTAAIERLLSTERDDIWAGTPTELFEILKLKVGDEDRRSRAWPKNAQQLSAHLTRIKPALAEIGIEAESGHRGRGTSKTRWITLRDERVVKTAEEIIAAHKAAAQEDAEDAGDAQ